MESKGRRKPPSAIALLLVVLVVSLLAIPAVAYLGFSGSDDQAQEGVEETALDSEVSTTSPALVGSDYSEFVENSTGSQVSFYQISDGSRSGTATERFARPALSLSKLYIAAYVLDNGTTEEGYEAISMISSSDDRTATELYAAYPESIDSIADEYNLLSTRSGQQWGYSVTSTYDVVSFLAQLMEEDPTDPILVAMAGASSVAADGYDQDFGTAVLPGVLGSKWGWSDDRSLHSSVSFGENFIVAAAVTGSADDLTELVEFQLTDEVEQAIDEGEELS
ncbi:hypothetical protein C5L39_09135 [Corynebacterium alimapuense]|uniref:Serine hydrolase n=1 Tax=Corynebacterium alimapuense TaxID=1576874 RepID=A0A3M8K660_9CORY|nr:hypothetical protein C5L39_09135 [Corynebacterium alimapuense]